MRFATIEVGGRRRVAVEHGASGRLTVLPATFRTVLDVVGVEDLPIDEAESVDTAEVRYLAPIPEPVRNLLCVGKNYEEHAAEFAASGFDSSANGSVRPDHPIVFTKFGSSVIGPGDTVDLMTHITDMVDYEAELAVIIGRGGRDIPLDTAMDHVWGYTIVNDVTARDRQQRHKQWLLGKTLDTHCPMGPVAVTATGPIGRGGRDIPLDTAMDHVWGYTIVNDVTARDRQQRHKQWLLGKTLDTHCPMGPVAVTADEIDLAETIVTCQVNGEVRQCANTRDLIFSVPEIIATISEGFTLVRGDIIATGTPAGVGIGLDPPRFLRSGDVVSVSITNIGTLVNPFE